jgi:DNA polymerase-3 subunit delta
LGISFIYKGKTLTQKKTSKPSIYILHGDDSHEIERFTKMLVEKLGDVTTAEMNTTRLDGQHASQGDLHGAIMAMPFLAERRLVILQHPFPQSKAKTEQQRFLQLLDSVPETTALVLIIEDQLKNTKVKGQWISSWQVLNDKHWLMKWAQTTDQGLYIKDFSSPKQHALPNWILKEAKSQGGEFSLEAARTLVGHIGNDTRIARQEIEKLLTYVNFERPVEAEDVDLLTTSTGQVDVFELVDALATHKTSQALRCLHSLLDEQDPFSIFGMVIRQFRLLLLAREVLSTGGGPNEILKEISEVRSSFVANKVANQAGGFALSQLDQIYHRLLEMDEAIKTSQLNIELALDIFIAEMAAS